MNKTPFQRINVDCEAKQVDFPHKLAVQFERLLQNLEVLWGTPEAVKYLDELIMPARAGRQGFPLGVVMELTGLKELHESTYPSSSSHVRDPFSQWQ